MLTLGDKGPGRYLSVVRGNRSPSSILSFYTNRRVKSAEGNGGKRSESMSGWHSCRTRLSAGGHGKIVQSSGTDTDALWEFIYSASSISRPIWIFADDIGYHLTLAGFWDLLDAGEFTVTKAAKSGVMNKATCKGGRREVMCIEGRPTFIKCYRAGRTYHFVDTRNYVPSIDGVAASAESSALSTIEFMADFILRWKSSNCGSFRYTSAAMSIVSWRASCPVRTPDGESIDVLFKPNSIEHELERLAYHGGRTTCYYVGERKEIIYHLDVNSLFPSVMSSRLYPRKFSGFSREFTVNDLRNKMLAYSVVASVRIDSPIETFPIRISGEQYHCNGSFWTVLCGDELKRAVSSDCILDVGLVQWYSRADLFSEWVNLWHTRKSVSRSSGTREVNASYFYKSILNSLYGKFAQLSVGWETDSDAIAQERWGHWFTLNADTNDIERWRAVAGIPQKREIKDEPTHSFPLISAEISANAREFMYNVVRDSPVHSVYYMAVDSLICSHECYESLLRRQLVDGSAIGKFKIVGIHKECRIIGPNHYVIDGKTVCSGLFGRADFGEVEQGKVVLRPLLHSILSKKPGHAIRTQSVEAREPCHKIKGSIDGSGNWSPFHIVPGRPLDAIPSDFPFRPEHR